MTIEKACDYNKYIYMKKTSIIEFVETKIYEKKIRK